MVAICTSPVSELKELKDIFIELTAKNCNQRCRQCYIDFPLTKNIKDFLVKIENAFKNPISKSNLKDKSYNWLLTLFKKGGTRPEQNLSRLVIHSTKIYEFFSKC